MNYVASHALAGRQSNIINLLSKQDTDDECPFTNYIKVNSHICTCKAYDATDELVNAKEQLLDAADAVVQEYKTYGGFDLSSFNDRYFAKIKSYPDYKKLFLAYRDAVNNYCGDCSNAFPRRFVPLGTNDAKTGVYARSFLTIDGGLQSNRDGVRDSIKRALKSRGSRVRCFKAN